MRRFFCTLLLIGAGLMAVLVPAALAYTVTYAGPKTWLQGWDATGGSDAGTPFRWRIDSMGPKSDDSCFPNCSSRVAFILPSGTWTYSYTDSNSWTVRGIPEGSQYYDKRPFCKNNSSYVYIAQCDSST
jgi:hypothetical protein